MSSERKPQKIRQVDEAENYDKKGCTEPAHCKCEPSLLTCLTTEDTVWKQKWN